MHAISISVAFITSLWCAVGLATTPISEFKLKNGLTVVVKPDHRAPVAMTLLIYHVGSSYEPNGITGISHALEHMMFKTIKNYKTGDYSRLISDNGGSLNAFTGTDYTGYHVQIRANKLPLVFKLEAERMANLQFNEPEFIKEIDVVKEERHLRTENVPEALTYEHFQAAALMNIPYHNPIVGWPSDLDNMQLNDLITWYQTWYHPNNATLIVVGDVEPMEVLKLATEYFGAIKPKALPTIKSFTTAPTYGPRYLTVTRPAEVPLVLIGFNVPTVNSAAETWEPYALELLAGLLSQGESSRFSKSLIRQQQLAAAAIAAYDPYYRLPYLFIIQAIPAKGINIATLQEAILKEIKYLQDTLVPASELAKIQALTIANDIYAKDSLSSQAIKLGIFASIGLPLHEIDDYSQKIARVTPEQIQVVARKYLIAEHMTVATLKPQSLTQTQEAQ